ncbi:unnamed protein product, partial [Arabidopsis halleri]
GATNKLKLRKKGQSFPVQLSLFSLFKQLKSRSTFFFFSSGSSSLIHGFLGDLRWWSLLLLRQLRCGRSPVGCNLGLFPGGLRRFSGLGLRTLVDRSGVVSQLSLAGVSLWLRRKSDGVRWVLAACLGDLIFRSKGFSRFWFTGLLSHSLSETLFGLCRNGLKVESAGEENGVDDDWI